MEVCKGCNEFSENRKKKGYSTIRLEEHCTNCGCPTASKLRCLSCKCPLEKWTEIMNADEEAALKQQMNGA
jgi:hypothetical protein